MSSKRAQAEPGTFAHTAAAPEGPNPLPQKRADLGSIPALTLHLPSLSSTWTSAVPCGVALPLRVGVAGLCRGEGNARWSLASVIAGARRIWLKVVWTDAGIEDALVLTAYCPVRSNGRGAV
jgi:hypothetical protein